MTKKNIVIVPPSGWMLIQDFSIHRLGKYFKNVKNIKTIVVKIDNKKLDGEFDNGGYVDEVINVSTEEELFKTIKELNPDLIFHRSWMLAYPFAAKLVKEFDNVVVNIKDWNFATKKEYKFIFDDISDFKAIKYIFKNSKYVLSHYTKEQAKIWAKEYNVNKNKFIFFPEYCNEENFSTKPISFNPNNTINLVAAGSLAPSSFPEQFFPTKGMLRGVNKLSKQNIQTNMITVPKYYDGIFEQKAIYQDILYENKFNPYFNILKGEILASNVLESFDFGFFQLEYTTKNEYLNKYAIPSKFAFYLEAGIPMIVNSKMESLAYYVEKYNLGIVFKNSNISNMREVLEINQSEYRDMINNIINFREKFLYSFDFNLGK